MIKNGKFNSMLGINYFYQQQKTSENINVTYADKRKQIFYQLFFFSLIFVNSNLFICRYSFVVAIFIYSSIYFFFFTYSVGIGQIFFSITYTHIYVNKNKTIYMYQLNLKASFPSMNHMNLKISYYRTYHFLRPQTTIIYKRF